MQAHFHTKTWIQENLDPNTLTKTFDLRYKPLKPGNIHDHSFILIYSYPFLPSLCGDCFYACSIAMKSSVHWPPRLSLTLYYPSYMHDCTDHHMMPDMHITLQCNARKGVSPQMMHVPTWVSHYSCEDYNTDEEEDNLLIFMLLLSTKGHCQSNIR